MGRNTEIAWTDHTFNPWIGCQRVSPGCEHCYAEQLARRSPALVHGQSGGAVVGLPVWGPQAPRRVTSAENWRQPLRWHKAALRDGVRRRVFCASLCDVFEEGKGAMGGLLDEARARLWTLIEQCTGLDWLLLTKRPEAVEWSVPLRWLRGEWPAHVWIGTTVEDQRRAEERLPHLLAIPAPVRFVSAEPLLEAADLWRWMGPKDPGIRDPRGTDGIDWLVVGGESGPGARPFDVAWARSLRDQCAAASVPYFFKQMGARPIYTTDGGGKRVLNLRDKKGGDPAEWPEDLRVRQWPT